MRKSVKIIIYLAIIIFAIIAIIYGLIEFAYNKKTDGRECCSCGSDNNGIGLTVCCECNYNTFEKISYMLGNI